MNKFFIMAGMLALSTAAQAQTKEGGLSEQMVRQIQQVQQPQQKALFNALAANKIDDLARNFEAQRQIDTYFSVETPKQSITDQKQSGRCWMFSGLNVLRANGEDAYVIGKIVTSEEKIVLC